MKNLMLYESNKTEITGHLDLTNDNGNITSIKLWKEISWKLWWIINQIYEENPWIWYRLNDYKWNRLNVIENADILLEFWKITSEEVIHIINQFSMVTRKLLSCWINEIISILEKNAPKMEWTDSNVESIESAFCNGMLPQSTENLCYQSN